MSLELFVLRHAKSDWDSGFSTDEKRVLSKRGRQDAPAMGAFMLQNELIPQQVCCSTAVRARETLDLVNNELDLADTNILYLPELYLASLSTLLHIITSYADGVRSIMLVGHNPGLDELVSYLSSSKVPRTQSGKLMTTCCLAHLSIQNNAANWQDDLQQQAELVSITRPADL